jgi:hypothetical protein
MPVIWSKIIFGELTGPNPANNVNGRAYIAKALTHILLLLYFNIFLGCVLGSHGLGSHLVWRPTHWEPTNWVGK